MCVLRIQILVHDPFSGPLIRTLETKILNPLLSDVDLKSLHIDFFNVPPLFQPIYVTMIVKKVPLVQKSPNRLEFKMENRNAVKSIPFIIPFRFISCFSALLQF